MFEVQYIFYAVVGKLFIYTLQKFPLLRDVKNKFIRELVDCNFCLGVWVFSVLAWLFHVVLFRDYIYCPVLSQIATGVITSILVYLIGLGWDEQFGKIVIEK
jgi:hypothetical protein